MQILLFVSAIVDRAMDAAFGNIICEVSERHSKHSVSGRGRGPETT